jgi:hypothetical protein
MRPSKKRQREGLQRMDKPKKSKRKNIARQPQMKEG